MLSHLTKYALDVGRQRMTISERSAQGIMGTSGRLLNACAQNEDTSRSTAGRRSGQTAVSILISGPLYKPCREWTVLKPVMGMPPYPRRRDGKPSLRKRLSLDSQRVHVGMFLEPRCVGQTRQKRKRHGTAHSSGAARPASMSSRKPSRVFWRLALPSSSARCLCIRAQTWRAASGVPARPGSRCNVPLTACRRTLGKCC